VERKFDVEQFNVSGPGLRLASGNEPYSGPSVQATYRVSFAIPAVGTLWLVYYRYYKMRGASAHLHHAKKKSHVTGYDVKSLRLTLTYFGPRLIATAGGWFANDVFFYGNKLFQSQFISVINPNAKNSVVPNWSYNVINVAVSLAGYYLACISPSMCSMLCNPDQVQRL
jgi:hypothetical protein